MPVADPRVGPHSAGVNMERLQTRVEPFLSMAPGGPNNHHGPGLRKSHAHLVAKGTDDSAFLAFVAHFADVLKELGVPDAKLAEVVPIFLGARSDASNR